MRRAALAKRCFARNPLQLSVSGTFPHSAISLPDRIEWIVMGSVALRDLLAHAETWPREDQEELAEYAREIEARRTGIYRMSDDERAAVSQGMAEADQGKFVSDDLVAKADKRHDQ
jgi:hypothetical protein